MGTKYMHRAMAMAREAIGNVSPNPAVGAVLVNGEKVVSEGFSSPAGGLHAEAVVLQQAGADAQGATLYVTLEPCCHYGRTPPCTKAILASGVKEVHIATLDPNPMVAGKGKAELEEAGIAVIFGEEEKEARQINEAYLKYIVTSLPFVIAKFAASLDGKNATVDGHSQWITGEAARREVHHLRAVCDAVMVGINTVVKDEPRLTTRDNGIPRERQPVRVVVDSHGRIHRKAQLLQEPGRVLVAVTRVTTAKQRELEQAGAEVLHLPAADGMVDLRALLEALGQRNVTSVLVEGGGTLTGSLFQHHLVDKVVAFFAPKIIGGRDAPTPVEGNGVRELGDALSLTNVAVERVGEDIMVIGYTGG